MKFTKKVLCVIMAIAVMTGTLGLMTVLADNSASVSSNPVATTAGFLSNSSDTNYLFKFDNSLQTNWLSCNEMSTLYGEEIGKGNEYVESDVKTGSTATYNSDGSLTLSKDKTQLGANLEIKVTDEMRENYKKATDNKFIVSYYLSEAAMTKGNFEGAFTDCQVRVYTKFKSKYTEMVNDKPIERQIKLTSIGKSSYNCYQQVINKEFKFLDGTSDGSEKPLENFDNVESIIISLYNFSELKATLQMSAFAYEGTPSYIKFVSPKPAGVNDKISFTDWNNHYRKDWADKPMTIKYSADGGYDASTYKTMTGSGWVYFKHMSDVQTKQLCLFFNLDRDAFNKAIVTANQEGGSKKAHFTVNFPQIEDNTGATMMAELELQLVKYGGETLTPIKQFVKAAKETTLTFDVSSLDVNSVNYIKVSLMAFWQYDKSEDKYYDIDKAKKYDKDGNLLTAKYVNDEFVGYENGKSSTLLQEKDIAKYTADCSDGRKNVDVTTKVKNKTLALRVMKNVQGYVSPFYTGSGSGPSDNKTTTTTTTSANTEYKYAGYHFYDFTQQAFNETYGWGTHASYVNFLSDDYYMSYEIVDKDLAKDGEKQGYANTKTPGKKVTGNTTYKKQISESKSLYSGGYQVELSSPNPRVQQQHQSYFFLSGAQEDKSRTSETGDHNILKPQNEKYDYTTQMKNGLKYAKQHTDPEKRGFLAIDVQVLDSVHGFKNVYNKTYGAWCKSNNKKAVNEKSAVEVLVAIHASNDDEDYTAMYMGYVPVGEKKTLYLDVSELEADYITGIRIAAQNYANLANKQQGGNNNPCGITDVQVRYSALYIPSSLDAGLTTTVNVTEAPDEKAKLKIKKLYDALPGTELEDYIVEGDFAATEANYNKLVAFMKAWQEAPLATQAECEKEYGIDFITLSMLEADLYDYLYLNGDWGDDPYSTGDLAFPMVSLLVAGIAGYVIIRTRKKKA